MNLVQLPMRRHAVVQNFLCTKMPAIARRGSVAAVFSPSATRLFEIFVHGSQRNQTQT